MKIEFVSENQLGQHFQNLAELYHYHRIRVLLVHSEHANKLPNIIIKALPAPFDIENMFFFYKTGCPNVEVNRTKPSIHPVSVPWYTLISATIFFFLYETEKNLQRTFGKCH